MRNVFIYLGAAANHAEPRLSGQVCRAYDVYLKDDFGAETSRGNRARSFKIHHTDGARGNGKPRAARACNTGAIGPYCTYFRRVLQYIPTPPLDGLALRCRFSIFINKFLNFFVIFFIIRNFHLFQSAYNWCSTSQNHRFAHFQAF